MTKDEIQMTKEIQKTKIKALQSPIHSLIF